MILPTPPGKGDSVLQWARNMTAYLRSLRPSSGPGIRIQHTPAGMAISTDPARPTPTEPPILFPWQAYPAPYEGSGTPPPDQWRKFRVAPGIVNNRLPDNYLATFTAEVGYTLGLDITIAYSENTLNISSAQLVYTGTPPPPINRDGDGKPTTAYIRLALVSSNATLSRLDISPLRRTPISITTILGENSCTQVSYNLLIA